MGALVKNEDITKGTAGHEECPEITFFSQFYLREAIKIENLVKSGNLPD